MHLPGALADTANLHIAVQSGALLRQRCHHHQLRRRNRHAVGVTLHLRQLRDERRRVMTEYGVDLLCAPARMTIAVSSLPVCCSMA